MRDIGKEMHDLARRLWPICRSITGPGVRETLSVLRESLSGMHVHAVPSGTRCFDWTVPEEWRISDAYVIGPDGSKVIDMKQNNLHVVGYSSPVDAQMSLEELQPHLYSLPDQPEAIPYVTSYYKRRWGFCLTDRARRSLAQGLYRVRIESELVSGQLNYGELIIPGESDDEVFLSTYICHPSMANNELSGPVVTTFLARWLMSLQCRRFTYRIVFAPETIGALCYLSTHLETLKRNVKAGFIVTCVGDERAYSFLPSRAGDTLADRAARHALGCIDRNFVRYSFLDRGSDERQYCSPGANLPMATIMRSKYGCYPEYHTSLDDLELVTPAGLYGGYSALCAAISIIEGNRVPRANFVGEPQLGRRGLYPTLSVKHSGDQVRTMMNLLAYADGQSTLLDIAEKINAPFDELEALCRLLESKEVLTCTF
jgi:aminopeptidase-like protein